MRFLLLYRVVEVSVRSSLKNLQLNLKENCQNIGRMLTAGSGDGAKCELIFHILLICLPAD